MNNDLYSDYVRREPHPKGATLIRRWHGRLLELAMQQTHTKPNRVLEVGPGHGYFAEQCSKHGIEYEFCDTSPAVIAKMTDLGFNGYLGQLTEVKDQLNSYDLVWFSHVLEHAPTWLDAREMIAVAQELLNDNGAVIVVSPDVLSWRREFWNVDWSHGYPTSIRNVSQLFSDVGLKDISAKHHRNGSFSIVQRALISTLCVIPHRLIDRTLSPSRYRLGDGFAYSWKCVFGWRQIFVVGFRKSNL